ncbi:hypothetical protein DL95DRAFT_468686 [Leptodontidium sp. 2 PMI_412]|nr:hypothetical protein DL95DRAFT_468686 [Leptodontidium sp. 2 PMI_412]
MKSTLLALSAFLIASTSAASLAIGTASPASVAFNDTTALTERDIQSASSFQLFTYNFDESWRNQITSLKTSIGQAHECTIFEDLFCGPTGRTEVFNSRDSPDLRTSNMNDIAKSYTCRESAIIVPVS